MKLSDTIGMAVGDSHFAMSMPILESGEGPRWRFDYDRYKNDASPDILLLGDYNNPNTGNHLIGGINLHYLSDEQQNALTKVLPSIMKQGNLYKRYHAGKAALPDVFKNFYRTYNADGINNVEKDVMHPKYGLMRTAGNWLKQKLAGLFRTKQQRAAAVQPKYPDDINQMQDKWDQAATKIAQTQQPKSITTPEPRPIDQQDVKQIENIPVYQAKQDQKQPVQSTTNRQITPQRPHPPDPIERQQAAKIEFEKEKRKNETELLNPKNDIDLGGTNIVGESIVYYCPIEKQYILEILT